MDDTRYINARYYATSTVASDTATYITYGGESGTSVNNWETEEYLSDYNNPLHSATYVPYTPAFVPYLSENSVSLDTLDTGRWEEDNEWNDVNLEVFDENMLTIKNIIKEIQSFDKSLIERYLHTYYNPQDKKVEITKHTAIVTSGATGESEEVVEYKFDGVLVFLKMEKIVWYCCDKITAKLISFDDIFDGNDVDTSSKKITVDDIINYAETSTETYGDVKNEYDKRNGYFAYGIPDFTNEIPDVTRDNVRWEERW